MTQTQQEIDLATQLLLRKAFREYYFNLMKNLEFPRFIRLREFGFMHFGGSGMTRHLSFDGIGHLGAALIREVPSDVYHSNAYYRFPTAPIHEKQWCGADLIFDIDGKDLDLECVPSHSYGVCKKCKEVTTGAESRSEYSCRVCSSKEVNRISLPCGKCIRASKEQVRSLTEILMEDLGLARKEIHAYFSGNNGFHIAVKNTAFIAHDPHLRADIIGYILGNGLMIESIGVRRDGLVTPALAEDGFRIKYPKGGLIYGWRYRVGKRLGLQNGSPSEDKLRKLVKTHGGYDGFRTAFEKMVHEMGTLIDPQVTTDMHRIFRMPGTLNSKSGLAKVRCRDIDMFDPFKEACLLSDEPVNVRVKTPVQINLKGKRIRVKKESLQLPTYAAVYLICKGLAEAL